MCEWNTCISCHYTHKHFIHIFFWRTCCGVRATHTITLFWASFGWGSNCCHARLVENIDTKSFIAVRADRAMERRESIAVSNAHVSEATFMYASGNLYEPCEYDAPNQWHLLSSNRNFSINIIIVNTNSISLLACQLSKMCVFFCSLFLSFCPPMLIVLASRWGGLVQ